MSAQSSQAHPQAARLGAGPKIRAAKSGPMSGMRHLWALQPLIVNSAQSLPVEDIQKAVTLLRREHHGHLATFHQWLSLDLGDWRRFDLDALQKLVANVLVRHFAAAKTQRHLDLVALVEEPAHRAHLHFVVVVVDPRPQLDLLDLDYLLTLARFGGLLLLEKAILPEIEDLADRRGGVGDDFDQIERGLVGELLGV